jgi:hypothetical protein
MRTPGAANGLFYKHVVAPSAKRRETASNLIELDQTRQHFNGALYAHHPNVLYVLHGQSPHVRPTKRENNRWIRATRPQLSIV